MRTIAILNQKGGCGKTTTAINLASGLARLGQRVLLVDLDPQGHCALGLGVPEAKIDLDITDALLNPGRRLDPARLLWRVSRNLDVAPARMKLAGLEASRGGLADAPDRERRLALFLQDLHEEYDVALVDCPPSIGLLTYNALAAASVVLIPVETQFFSLQGASRQVSTIKALSRRLGLAAPLWILPTIHDEDNAIAGDLLTELSRRFRDRVAPVAIRRDPRLREAASHGRAISDFAPGSSGCTDYATLSQWMLSELAKTPATPMRVEEEAEAPTGDTALVDAIIGPRETARPAPMPVAVPPVAAAPDPKVEELKHVNRAEDVARRAQEFLRRVALGQGAQPSGGPQTAPPGTPIAEASTSSSPSQATATQPMATTAAPHATLRLVEPEPTLTPPVHASVQRVLGVRETSQGVLFVQPLSAGQSLFIAGDFNGWSPSETPMRRNTALGVHEACLPLPEGRYRYRIVVDGQWQTDPFNDHCEPSPFGEPNNVLTVTRRPSLARA